MPRTTPALHQNVIHVTVRLQGPSPGSANSVHTFALEGTQGGNSVDLAQIEPRVAAALTVIYGVNPIGWTYRGFTMEQFNSSGTVVDYVDHIANVPGTVAVPLLPPLACIMVTKDVGPVFGYRPRPKGRMFVPLVAEAAVNDDGTLNVAAIAAATTRWNNFLADLSSPNLPGTPCHMILEWARMNDVAAAHFFVNQVQVAPRVRYLRSRDK